MNINYVASLNHMEEMTERRVAVVIEDDADVRHLLETVLTQSGFETIVTANGAEGIIAVQEYQPLVTTLDVSMPGMDGFAVAKKLRTFSSTYLIMLTALSDEIDIIQGLNSGADDYLLKPFRPRELRARIETMLRRPRGRDEGVEEEAFEAVTSIAPRQTVTAIHAPATIMRSGGSAAAAVMREEVLAPEPVLERPRRLVARAAQPAPAPAPEPVAAPVQVAHEDSPEAWLNHRGLSVNIDTHTVIAEGLDAELTRSEFDLLATLMTSGRRVRSKADLVLTLRGESYVTTYFVNDADKRAVEVHMANLRRKIGESSTTPKWIETVRGVGYRMTSAD
ncbi:MAG: DNA-binding response regulator [Nocardioidaceae bacterium]|nr:DNA-binding response regulator [Nocardioidaceae bacterium]